MAKNNKPFEKIPRNTVIEAATRIGVHVCELSRMGASLRLLSALSGQKSYTRIYKQRLCNDPSAQRLHVRQPPKTEVELLLRWSKANPLLAEAMKKRDITPRRWCCYYGIVTSSRGDADIGALLDPLRAELDTEIPVQYLLEEDFPAAFGLNKLYWVKPIDYGLYYNYNSVWLKKGMHMHVFFIKSLNILAMNTVAEVAFYVFSRRLYQEVMDKRLTTLIELGLPDDDPLMIANINKALSWLPEDVSKTRTLPQGKNQGAGHKILREKAIAAGLE